MLSLPFSLRDLQEEITGVRTGTYSLTQAISDSGMPYNSLAEFDGYSAITLDPPTFITANYTEFPDAISISWNTVTDADEYEYLLSSDVEGTGVNLGTTNNGSSTTYSETWINASSSGMGKNGSINVRAKKNPSTYSDWSTPLTFYLILDAPSITSHSSGHTFIANSTTYTVEYSSITNANEYQRQLYNAFDLGGTIELDNTVSGTSISFTGTQLKSYIGSSGSFRVRARRNSADHSSEWSAYINVYCQDPIGTPTISSPTEGQNLPYTGGGIETFTWNSIGDAVEYDWELKRLDSGTPFDSGTVSTTFFDYNEDTLYFTLDGGTMDGQVRVRAKNSHQTGTWSSWRTFTLS